MKRILAFFAIVVLFSAFSADDAFAAARKKSRSAAYCPYDVKLSKPCTCQYGLGFPSTWVCRVGQLCDSWSGCQDKDPWIPPH
jgi:hypothetical protein